MSAKLRFRANSIRRDDEEWWEIVSPEGANGHDGRNVSNRCCFHHHGRQQDAWLTKARRTVRLQIQVSGMVS